MPPSSLLSMPDKVVVVIVAEAGWSTVPSFGLTFNVGDIECVKEGKIAGEKKQL